MLEKLAQPNWVRLTRMGGPLGCSPALPVLPAPMEGPAKPSWASLFPGTREAERGGGRAHTFWFVPRLTSVAEVTSMGPTTKSHNLPKA